METDDEDKVVQILTYGKCDGQCRGKNPACSDHTCPYSEEINNNFGLCNCCIECQQQCAWDI